jgi:cytochrome P450
MRLYPPAWIVGRACVEEDDFGEFKVKPGEWVFLPPWVIHRRPELWPEPERFDPDRFLPEAVAKRDKLAWIPFSAGQRKCIGDQFAMMEADLVLATLIQKFRYSPEYTQITPEPLVTLRPKGGLPMSLARA